MSDWICPNCNGGFPDKDQDACPWCGIDIDESYEPENELVQSISRVENDDDYQPGLMDLFRP